MFELKLKLTLSKNSDLGNGMKKQIKSLVNLVMIWGKLGNLFAMIFFF